MKFILETERLILNADLDVIRYRGDPAFVSIDVKAKREHFGWDKNLYPVVVLPIGYPDEFTSAKKRRPIEDLIID
ncbi:hypothetical protein DWB61_17150 [Ancylomarina euxinus]|uniref:Nitroreductase domain-containing protein n=1 Tax=Ancylomarina euxinus TaxID=2283627 RepID=A0A425XWL4_9BACT|nr:hypothetical protein [Ancylomarina euxinus]MCZ4696388.1 hypothetical protein [Ancylomarina euxinus]MUP16459.1 hypothetical protein [Ancylomarina euxinus]RRG19039.1 hypothetical protein DWB61_17150 [Ancylomarina euxinus]